MIRCKIKQPTNHVTEVDQAVKGHLVLINIMAVVVLIRCVLLHFVQD